MVKGRGHRECTFHRIAAEILLRIRTASIIDSPEPKDTRDDENCKQATKTKFVAANKSSQQTTDRISTMRCK
ncbi:hypothetical protein L596_008324 [Steinernema carpocapsae]|uniref:Uncharacterized protein n=1 Tax=Steinernema carpocapsae TaxID=34508 RepID=A0A4U5PCE6_STECR|nr:hypothetical protein L596_008324 [Steinernema carpocapsae]